MLIAAVGIAIGVGWQYIKAYGVIDHVVSAVVDYIQHLFIKASDYIKERVAKRQRMVKEMFDCARSRDRRTPQEIDLRSKITCHKCGKDIEQTHRLVCREDENGRPIQAEKNNEEST